MTAINSIESLVDAVRVQAGIFGVSFPEGDIKTTEDVKATLSTNFEDFTKDFTVDKVSVCDEATFVEGKDQVVFKFNKDANTEITPDGKFCVLKPETMLTNVNKLIKSPMKLTDEKKFQVECVKQADIVDILDCEHGVKEGTKTLKYNKGNTAADQTFEVVDLKCNTEEEKKNADAAAAQKQKDADAAAAQEQKDADAAAAQEQKDVTAAEAQKTHYMSLEHFKNGHVALTVKNKDTITIACIENTADKTYNFAAEHKDEIEIKKTDQGWPADEKATEYAKCVENTTVHLQATKAEAKTQAENVYANELHFKNVILTPQDDGTIVITCKAPTAGNTISLVDANKAVIAQTGGSWPAATEFTNCVETPIVQATTEAEAKIQADVYMADLHFKDKKVELKEQADGSIKITCAAPTAGHTIALNGAEDTIVKTASGWPAATDYPICVEVSETKDAEDKKAQYMTIADFKDGNIVLTVADKDTIDIACVADTDDKKYKFGDDSKLKQIKKDATSGWPDESKKDDYATCVENEDADAEEDSSVAKAGASFVVAAVAGLVFALL